MALRWYTLVVDCQDVRKQATWWAQALDWTVIHESDKECVIVPSWADDTLIEQTPWERVGPGMVFVPVPERKSIKNRLHIDLAPHISQDRDAEIERLERLGAKRVDVGQSDAASWTVLTDPEGNEFCVLSSREM
jgi:Glyoxalase-like domain